MKSSKVHTVARKTNYREGRPNDYIYDPIYFVSGAKDHDRCSMAAVKETAEFQICPVYNSMFTDLKTHPRNVLALKSLDKVPKFVDKSWSGKQRAMELHKEGSKTIDVAGVDRHRFFNAGPSGPIYETTPAPCLPTAVHTPRRREEKTRARGTQTIYRESETQTVPWSTPYLVHGDTVPEILSIAHLSWGNGLPAGLHEVEIIERARVKRAWEGALPPVTDQASAEKRRHVIESIEREEWAQREKDIQLINDLRLELTQKLLDQQLVQLAEVSAKRVKKHAAKVEKEKARKLAILRRDTERALRKLRFKHEGINMKYHKVDIVEEHADRRSELYGPLIRHGEHPKRGHEVLLCRSRAHDASLPLDDNMLPGLEAIRFAGPKTDKGYELCVRETHWTPEKLKALHEELKEVRLNRGGGPRPLRLLQRLPKPVPRPVTPEVEAVPDREEDLFQASVFLQKVLRGRAVQTMMCEGREKCRELIEELKSTFSLLEAGLRLRYEERLDAVTQQRFHTVELKKLGAMNEMLGALEGSTIAQTLDFLAKELWRLQDERRAHAFALLAERERHRREAAEAGRRQVEERRRKEHDEMFKQIVKVHQDTVDIYLEDLILDSMSWVAESEARNYIRELARRVDRAAMQAHKRKDCIEQEELVADLIHNFVLPEVQKSFVRDKMRKRQQKYLAAAYDSIHERVDAMTIPPSTSEGDLAVQSEEALDIEIGHMVDRAIDSAVEDSYRRECEKELLRSVEEATEPNSEMEIEAPLEQEDREIESEQGDGDEVELSVIDIDDQAEVKDSQTGFDSSAYAEGSVTPEDVEKMEETEDIIKEAGETITESEETTKGTDETVDETVETIGETEEAIKEAEEVLQETVEPIIESGEPAKETEEAIIDTGEPITETVKETEDAVIETGETVKETEEAKTETGEPIIETGEPIIETGETVKEIGEPIIETGEPIVESGEPTKETEEAVIETGEPKIETGEIQKETGEAVIETGEPIAESGETQKEAGELIVEETPKETEEVTKESEGTVKEAVETLKETEEPPQSEGQEKKADE